jgi:hypothetical protein
LDLLSPGHAPRPQVEIEEGGGAFHVGGGLVVPVGGEVQVANLGHLAKELPSSARASGERTRVWKLLERFWRAAWRSGWSSGRVRDRTSSTFSESAKLPAGRRGMA